MRILQVITDTDRRGAQVFATDLGAALGSIGHLVETVALAPGSTSPALEVEVLGPTRRSRQTLLSLRRKMKNVDVTIAHGSATGLACALAGLGPGRPFVYRQISDTRFWAGSFARRLRVSLYLRRAQRIVALSDGAKADLVAHLRLPARMITVVPNGVPVREYRRPTDDERAGARELLGLGADDFVALYIGALVPEKGVDTAIEALAGVEGVELAIVGGGPDLGRLQTLASSATGASNIHFLGSLDRPFDAYAAADVVLLPSKGGDSMPATLIEAGFCGRPSVSTDIGSITDIVLHDRTGVIVEAGNLAALREAVTDLAADLQRRAALGEAAMAHCLAKFEIDVVADGWARTLSTAARR